MSTDGSLAAASGMQSSRMERLEVRREKRRGVTKERRLQAEKAYQEDKRRAKCARARFDAEVSAVLQHLREAAGRWQARRPQTTDPLETQPKPVIPVCNRIRENFAGIQRLLRSAAGDDTEDGRETVLCSRAAAKIRDELDALAKNLDRHLTLIGKLLPSEQHAEAYDRLEPGSIRLLSQLRKFVNKLESLEEDTVKLTCRADRDVVKGRPTVLNTDESILHLANVWLKTTGECPSESRSNAGPRAADKGEFSEWAMKTLSRLNPEVERANSGKQAPIAVALRRLKDQGYLP